MPLQGFRLRLVDLLDHLLQILDQDPEFLHFHLDSQTIVLDDYLEMRPEREADLRRHIAAGRIEVGPWYVLNDTFLTSGEATIHNLMLGSRMAAEFGRVGRIGYLPDQFGNIAQLPQIFVGFGLHDSVVGRGISMADVPLEFAWEAPDGSRVLVTMLHGWYNNAQRLADVPAQAVRQLEGAAAHLAAHSRTHQRLLMNGVDHLEPQENLSAVLAAVRPHLGGSELRHSSLAEYFAAVRAELGDAAVKEPPAQALGRPTLWRGELRQQPVRHFVLNGTLSARMYLKLANHRCQLDLERRAEPWLAVAEMCGAPADRGALWTAWRYLLQNHPHDSICGCSVDGVHRDMLPRFAHAAEIAAELARRSRVEVLGRVTVDVPPGQAAALAVFNSLGFVRDALLTVDVDLPREGHGERVRLRDVATGAEVPCLVEALGPAHRLAIGPIELPHPVAAHRFRLRFLARELPAVGYRAYIVERVGGQRFVYGRERPVQDEGLYTFSAQEGLGGGNRHLEVRLDRDGTFRLRPHGEPEREMRGLGLLVDDGEAGDEYLHEPPLRDRAVLGLAGNPHISMEEAGPDWLIWAVRGELRVPERLVAERQARGEATVDLPVTMRLILRRDARQLEIEVSLDNRALDHRVRILFPTGLRAEFSQAAGQFAVVSRATEIPPTGEAQGNHPAEQFVDLVDPRQDRGLGVLLDGTPEYAVLDGVDGQTLAVTLLRATDVVGDNAAFDRAPEAQCLGPLTVRLGLVPHRGDWRAARLHQEALALELAPDAQQFGLEPGFRRLAPAPLDPPARQDPSGPVGNRFAAPAPERTLPAAHSFLHLEGEAVLSAVRPAEDGRGLVVRVFNPATVETVVRLSLDRPLAEAEQLTMGEEPLAGLPLAPEGGVTLRLAPGRIATVRLVPAGSTRGGR